MTVPPITIGLPVYNGENYLQIAIDSLVEQTFDDFMLIISDNASRDGTEEIAREAARRDSRIRYYRHSVNLGAPANYNFTLAQAESEFFMWHAHDDVRAPQFLNEAYATIVESDDVSVVFSRSQWIGPRGELGELKPSYDDLMSPLVHRRLRAAIHHGPMVIFGLTRRSMLESVGGHGIFQGGDRLTVVQLAMLGQFVELPGILFFNRRHPDQYGSMGNDRSQVTAWWNPAEVERIIFPRWRGLGAYIESVRKAPLSATKQLNCYGNIALGIFDNRMYLAKQLARDLVIASVQLGRKVTARR